MGILEKLHLRGGETGASGLNQKENTFTFLLIVIGPFYFMQFIIQFFVPQEYWVFVWPCGIAIWLASIVAYNSSKQGEAATFKSFPASLWRFTDGMANIDLFVPPKVGEGGLEFIGHWGEKSKFAYWVPFAGAIQWNEDVFDRAIFVCPDDWDNSFFFRPGGETWWKGVPVTHPSSEGLVLHVLPREEWHDHMGETVPIVVVADCDWYYGQRREELEESREDLAEEAKDVPKNVKAAVDNNVKLTAGEVLEIKNSIYRKENIELNTRCSNLEDHLEAALNQSVDIAKWRREMMADVKRRHGDIMRVTPPLKYRLINMKNVAIALLVLGLVALIYLWSSGGL